MRGRGFILVGVIAILPIGLIVLFHRFLNEFNEKSGGVVAALSILASVYLFIGNLYYLRSEAVYLWVHRQLLRFRNVHTFWRFTVAYSRVGWLVVEGKSQVDAISNDLHERISQAFKDQTISDERLTNSYTA